MKSQVQSLIFDKALFTEEEAVEWADKHGYRSNHGYEQKNTWRLRQADPEHFDKFRTEVLANGVKAVVGTIVKRNPAPTVDELLPDEYREDLWYACIYTRESDFDGWHPRYQKGDHEVDLDHLNESNDPVQFGCYEDPSLALRDAERFVGPGTEVCVEVIYAPEWYRTEMRTGSQESEIIANENWEGTRIAREQYYWDENGEQSYGYEVEELYWTEYDDYGEDVRRARHIALRKGVMRHIDNAFTRKEERESGRGLSSNRHTGSFFREGPTNAQEAYDAVADRVTRRTRNNPAEDINLLQMPDASEINARFQEAFDLPEVDGIYAPDCTGEITAFLEYIHLALKALPGILQPDLECEYNFQKDEYSITLMWLSDEGLSWQGFVEGAQRPPQDQWETIEYEPDEDEGVAFPEGRLRLEGELGRVVWVINVLSLMEMRRRNQRIDEPAYLTHHQVMTHGAHHVDDLVASGQWTYPTNQYGQPLKTKTAMRVARDEGGGLIQRANRYFGSWQFIGAWHPQWKTEEDFRYWLPQRFGGTHNRRRRISSRRRARR